VRARKFKLTKRSIEAAKPDKWDTEASGFGCKVTPKDARVFLLQYWASGRARRATLGHCGCDLSPDQARTKARRLRSQVADGGDPAGERAESRAMPTLGNFAVRYRVEHAEVKKKPSSVESDERNLRFHVLPALGCLRVDKITRADVARIHAAMKHKSGAANRCLSLLSKMLGLAEAWGLRSDGSNPQGSTMSTATPRQAPRRSSTPVFCGISGSNRTSRMASIFSPKDGDIGLCVRCNFPLYACYETSILADMRREFVPVIVGDLPEWQRPRIPGPIPGIRKTAKRGAISCI